MTKFQIRDERYGLAIYEAESAEDALAAFLADRVKGDVLAAAETGADGVGTVTYRGRTYYAVPPVKG